MAGDQRLRHQDQAPDLRLRGAEPAAAAAVRCPGEKEPVGGPLRSLRRVESLRARAWRLDHLPVAVPGPGADALRRAGLGSCPPEPGRDGPAGHRGGHRRRGRRAADPRLPGSRARLRAGEQTRPAGRRPHSRGHPAARGSRPCGGIPAAGSHRSRGSRKPQTPVASSWRKLSRCRCSTRSTIPTRGGDNRGW